MKISTLQDITSLSEEEFERLIPDLRNYCTFHRNLQKKIGAEYVIDSSFDWIDDWKNDAMCTITIVN